MLIFEVPILFALLPVETQTVQQIKCFRTNQDLLKYNKTV